MHAECKWDEHVRLHWRIHDARRRHISHNHGHGTVPVPGRESHTADLKEFEHYIEIMEQADRLEQDIRWDEEDEEDEEDIFDQLIPASNSAVDAAAGAYVKPGQQRHRKE